MYRIDRKREFLNEILRLIDSLEEERHMPTRPMGEEFHIVLANYKKRTEPKKEEREEIPPEIIAISQAFFRLEECLRDLVDTLQILPENIARSVRDAIQTGSNMTKDALKQKVTLAKDKKTGKSVFILDTPKELKALDETEGILEQIWRKLEKEKIDTPELVRRTWKTA